MEESARFVYAPVPSRRLAESDQAQRRTYRGETFWHYGDGTYGEAS